MRIVAFDTVTEAVLVGRLTVPPVLLLSGF